MRHLPLSAEVHDAQKTRVGFGGESPLEQL